MAEILMVSRPISKTNRHGTGKWHRFNHDDPATEHTACGRPSKGWKVQRQDDCSPDLSYCLDCDRRAYANQAERRRERAKRKADRLEPDEVSREIVLREADRCFKAAFGEDDKRAASLVRAIEKHWHPKAVSTDTIQALYRWCFINHIQSHEERESCETCSAISIMENQNR